MKLSLGIVGLPNVGKSTLFNALTKQEVLAANYPFATIDPNHGIVTVHDERLEKITEIQKPAKVVPAVVEFVDIAGLVKGASKGEGLGNQFLAHIREVSAIVHLVRAFKNDNITHVENSVDPSRDIELIHTELILKDLESIQQKMKALESKARANPKLKPAVEYIIQLEAHLSEGKRAYSFEHSNNEECIMTRKELYLLTDKPEIFVINVEIENEDSATNLVREYVGQDVDVIAMDIKTEAELVQLEDDERKEFMNELGITVSGLDKLTNIAYKTLGLISYFTSGPQEVRAWTIRKGETAPEAAAAIHTDIQKNFIAADVVDSEKFIEFEGWAGSKDKGAVRLEGKSYIVKDGDIILFKHNG